MPRFLEIRLGSLGKGMMRRLVAQKLSCSPEDLDDRFCSDIYKQSQGNAYFTGEMIEHMKKLSMITKSKTTGKYSWNREECNKEERDFSSLGQLFLHRFDGLDPRCCSRGKKRS